MERVADFQRGLLLAEGAYTVPIIIILFSLWLLRYDSQKNCAGVLLIGPYTCNTQT